jgi:hypothetical protein
MKQVNLCDTQIVNTLKGVLYYFVHSVDFWLKW